MDIKVNIADGLNQDIRKNNKDIVLFKIITN